MILLRRNGRFLEAMLGCQEIPKKSVYSVEIGTTCWKEWEFRISLKFDRCSVKWLVLRLIWYSCLAVSQGNITPLLFVLSHLKKICLGIKVVWYWFVNRKRPLIICKTNLIWSEQSDSDIKSSEQIHSQDPFPRNLLRRDVKGSQCFKSQSCTNTRFVHLYFYSFSDRDIANIDKKNSGEQLQRWVYIKSIWPRWDWFLAFNM